MFDVLPKMLFILDNGKNHRYDALGVWVLYPCTEAFTVHAGGSGEWIYFTWYENKVTYYANSSYGFNNPTTIYLWLALS